MLAACGLSDPGCVRSNNEDFLFLDEELGLFIVADGMGGAQGGEHASRLATEFVVDRIRASKSHDLATLTRSIEDANRAVMEAASKSSMLEGMGTTLVAMLAKPAPAGDASPLLIASVGDSRGYVHSANRFSRITEDQTWVNEIGRQVLTEEALRTHPMRHVLTMAVGVSQPLRVNTYEVSLAPGETLLLSSDGLHGVLSDEAMSAILQSTAGLDVKCGVLIQAAREAGGPDNITALLAMPR